MKRNFFIAVAVLILVGGLVGGYLATRPTMLGVSPEPGGENSEPGVTITATPLVPPKTARTVHVFVALCDNDSQGIVPVPAALGNGDDPKNNLYWGAMYGVKTFLKKSPSWSLVSEDEGSGDDVLRRVIFKHTGGDVYLVADAYRGSCIKNAVTDFLSAAGGGNAAGHKVGEQVLGLSGSADLIVYVGHNGLMDFAVDRQRRAARGGERQAMVLACKSRDYFRERLTALGCRSVLFTTGFMAPEAYTFDAAVRAWIAEESGRTIRKRAAEAYDKYQKCGLAGARRLFCGEEVPPRVDRQTGRVDVVEETPPVQPLAGAARKQVGVTTIYDPKYVKLKYPGGDMPIERGVCTDVVIRALRDALHMDLQKLVHEDMKKAFSTYPALWGLRGPDPNIDHRRVPNLRHFFKRKGYSLEIRTNKEDYLPGDIVTCTLPGNLAHIMIVSDRKTENGVPLVIHNIGQGAREEARLFEFPLTGHFRIRGNTELKEEKTR